jgi:anti-anti-sigma regulatory factor
MLNVMIANSGNRAILRCSGRIVAGQERALLDAVESLKPGRVVVLDLTGVSGIDARGLGALLAVKQWAALGAGVKLQLIPSRAVQELLDLTRLSSEFELCSPETFFMVDPQDANGLGNSADA